MKPGPKSRAGIMILLLVAQVLFWLFYVPGGPHLVDRAIPSESGSVHFLDKPSAFLDLAVQPPWVNLIAAVQDDDPGEVADGLNDAELRRRMERLTGSRTCVATLNPAFGMREEAVVFASWLGAKGRLVYWALQLGLVSNVERTGTRSGTATWEYRGRDVPRGKRFTFAVEEGLLMGVFSSGSVQVGHVLQCYNGRRRSLAFSKDWKNSYEHLKPASSLSSGWMRPGPGWGRLFYSLRSVEGVLQLEAGMPLGEPKPLMAEEEVASWMPPEPLAALVFEPGLLEPEWLAEVPGIWGTLARTMLGNSPRTSPVFLSIAGGPWSGRLKGVRIPSVLLCFKPEDPGQLMDQLRWALNRYAEEWGARVYLKPMAAGDVELQVLSSDKEKGLFDLSDSERPAFAVVGNWFVFASSRATLEQAVIGFRAGPAGRPLHPRFRGRDYFAWFDLAGIGSKVSAGLQLASVRYAFSSSDSSRRKLREIQYWTGLTEQVKAFQELNVDYRAENGWHELRAEFRNK